MNTLYIFVAVMISYAMFIAYMEYQAKEELERKLVTIESKAVSKTITKD